MNKPEYHVVNRPHGVTLGPFKSFGELDRYLNEVLDLEIRIGEEIVGRIRWFPEGGESPYEAPPQLLSEREVREVLRAEKVEEVQREAQRERLERLERDLKVATRYQSPLRDRPDYFGMKMYSAEDAIHRCERRRIIKLGGEPKVLKLKGES